MKDSERTISASVSRLGAGLAAERRIVPHDCLSCQGRFHAIVQAKYCSNACRQRAKNQRNAEAITAPAWTTNGHFFDD